MRSDEIHHLPECLPVMTEPIFLLWFPLYCSAIITTQHEDLIIGSSE